MSTAIGKPQAYPHPHVNEAWLARLREDIIDPALPIVDAHHHLWERPSGRYLLDELRADLAAGHNVRATVFIQCGFAYRADGPEELRPVGETEYVAAVAARAEALGLRACAGIVGYCDFRLGEPIDAVLEAHVAGRRRPLQGHPPERRLGCGGHHDHVLAGAAASVDGSRVPASGWRGWAGSGCRTNARCTIRSCQN